jgi:L-lactate dehydrogenase complex protein LldG
MMNTDREDPRLAGMISEIHIIFLRKSVIYPDLPSVAQLLRQRITEAPATYTTLISGPSRTADIERVAAVGVHGPLELHIILLED